MDPLRVTETRLLEKFPTTRSILHKICKFDGLI